MGPSTSGKNMETNGLSHILALTMQSRVSQPLRAVTQIRSMALSHYPRSQKYKEIWNLKKK
jgi:hypothetical protein